MKFIFNFKFKSMLRPCLQSFLMICFLASLSGCGIQSIPRSKNKVDETLAEISNQYKRRADLVPNLVNVVKGYASHEKETLESVVQARAKATQTTIDPSNLTAKQLKAFQGAQSQLSQSLGRLMVVVEKYPDLKANRNFLELQSQLEGTENRITIARQRYIQSIRKYNDLVTVFPTSLTNKYYFHFEKMPQWAAKASENVEQTPKVEF